MSQNVVFSLANFQPGYCWQGPQQYGTDLISLLTGTVNSTGKLIVGPNAPGPADQDAVWYRTVGGYLEGVYLFLGSWCRPHPVQASTGIRIIYDGAESELWSLDGGDGTNPLVSVPTATTGSFWQRDLNYGSDDGTSIFKFPVGVGVNPTAYDGAAATIIAQGASGGVEKVAIASKEMPNHTHTVPLYQGDSVNHADRINTCDENIFQNANYQSGDTGGDSGDKHTWSHQNMPPWRGVFFAKRTARTMITAS